MNVIDGFDDFGIDYLFELVDSMEEHPHPLIETMYHCELDFQTLNRYMESVFEHLQNLTDESPVLAPFFPFTFAQGTLFTVFSTLERSLDELCDVSSRVFEVKISYQTDSGPSISRSINYLSDVVGLRDLRRISSKRLLLSWRAVRNCYVHSAGRARSDLDRRHAKDVGLSMSEGGYIDLHVTDVQNFAETAYVLLHATFERLIAKIDLRR